MILPPPPDDRPSTQPPPPETVEQTLARLRMTLDNALLLLQYEREETARLRRVLAAAQEMLATCPADADSTNAYERAVARFRRLIAEVPR